jgi:hypothetical protein
MLNRPGFRSSEWMVAAVTAILNIVNSSTGWVSWKDAILPTLAAVGYVVSRGLAKTEARTTTTPAPPTA